MTIQHSAFLVTFCGTLRRPVRPNLRARDMRTNNQEYWDEQAADYDSLYTSPWWRREDDRVKEWLLRLSLPKDRVPVILDIGCGTGFLFRQLVAANICCEYVGFDISAEMIKNFHPS